MSPHPLAGTTTIPAVVERAVRGTNGAVTVGVEGWRTGVRRRFTMVAVLTSLTLLFPLLSMPTQPTCTAEPVAATAFEAPILETFNHRINAYLVVHQTVERVLAPRRSYADPEDIEEALAAMQSGIRAARPNARAGDIFTADIASVIQRRLQERLAVCNVTVEDVLWFINEERSPRVRKPAIHTPFPWALGSAMPAALLPALPPLSDDLQYRFADRDLVLIDTHADLVVDILVNALPAPGEAGQGTRRR